MERCPECANPLRDFCADLQRPVAGRSPDQPHPLPQHHEQVRNERHGPEVSLKHRNGTTGSARRPAAAPGSNRGSGAAGDENNQQPVGTCVGKHVEPSWEWMVGLVSYLPAGPLECRDVAILSWEFANMTRDAFTDDRAGMRSGWRMPCGRLPAGGDFERPDPRHPVPA